MPCSTAFPAARYAADQAGQRRAAPDQPHFDLWAANRWQLEQAGVGQIEVAGMCTRCQRDTFSRTAATTADRAALAR